MLLPRCHWAVAFWGLDVGIPRRAFLHGSRSGTLHISMEELTSRRDDGITLTSLTLDGGGRSSGGG